MIETDRRTFVQMLGAAGLTAAAVAPSVSKSTPRRTLALLFDSLISPFWVAALEQFRRELAARGWSALEAVSNLDDGRQYTQVKSMIERGVDGIVIVHTDDKAVIPSIRAANAAGIPMVHFNRAPAPSDAYSVAVVADNRKLMDQTVSALIDIARRGEPKRYRAAILLGDLGDANGLNRRNGFNDAASRHPEIVDVVAQIATEWNADKAFAGLSNALEAHPEIDFLVTSSDFLTPQIEQALRLAGKWHPSGEPGHVLIAGFDGDANGYAQLVAGYYDVDGVQNLDYEVDLTLKAFERLWAGQHVPKVLIDPGFVVSRSTFISQRDEMWGYEVSKADRVARDLAAAPPGALGSGTPGSTTLPLVGRPTFAPTAPPSGPGGVLLHLRGWTAFAGLTGLAKALFSVASVHDILLALLPLAILVVGQMLVLLIGQIDLSMTAIMAVSSIVSASVMTRYAAGLAPLAATALGLLAFLGIGLAVGLFNGVCHAFLRIPSFIATLAVMMVGGGAAVWYASTVSETISIGGLPAAFRFIGYGRIAGVPLALLLSLAALATVHFVLSRTVAGRWIYALGHNRAAAHISGVPVRGVTIAVFAASGVCAALAALIYTSRIETGLPTLGQDLLLDIVGAAVIGGVSLFGGRGSIWMVLAGATFLCTLDKVLQLLGVSLFAVLAVKGIAILAAALVDATRTRRLKSA